ncbi:MAG: hypothetical protein OXU26_13695, partial [Acidobacteriota bacterium]|nr:hypothetical protein [Acidobacteriota bacterium]
MTLASLGILASFLSLLFVASVRGRADGTTIPSPSVLGASGCYISGCHMTSDSTLNMVGSVSFDSLPTIFVPGETYDLGITMTGGSIYGFQLAAVFSDNTQAGTLTALTEHTMVEMLNVSDLDEDHDHDHDDNGDHDHDDNGEDDHHDNGEDDHHGDGEDDHHGDGDDGQTVQVLTHTRPLGANTVNFQWTAPMKSKGGSVFLKVATNSANGDGAPTGDAINTMEVSIPPDIMTQFVPVVLDSRGKNNSHFTS